MLTPDQIRHAIVDRMDAISDNCNRGHSMHNTGVIRGLLWALTGERPPMVIDAAQVCLLAGIPFREFLDNTYEVDEGWAKAASEGGES